MLQGHGQRSDLVVVGASLEGREHREVDAVLKVVHRALGLALHPPVALAALHSRKHASRSQVRKRPVQMAFRCLTPLEPWHTN